MEKERRIYRYEGPVFSFGRVISDKWKYGTRAVSEKEAIAHLTFNYKMKNKLTKEAKIELDKKCLTIIQ